MEGSEWASGSQEGKRTISIQDPEVFQAVRAVASGSQSNKCNSTALPEDLWLPEDG